MSDENNSKMAFIPFNAINEFMRADYRIILLRSVLNALPALSNETQKSVNRLTKKHVKVPGFRNSAKAPASVKAVSMVKPFEKEPKLVATILSAWAETNADLKEQIYEILADSGWKLLPIHANRSRLPGFLTQWPAEDDYEVLYGKYEDKYPDSNYGIDDVSLMAVWLSVRLPVEKVSKNEIHNLPFDFEQANEG
jgi:hypothetical protein